MCLLTITCLHNKTAVVTKRLVKSVCLGVQLYTYIEVNNLTTTVWHQIFVVQYFRNFRNNQITTKLFTTNI